MSETNSAREALAPFCRGHGLDLGFGGYAPIVPQAICVDRAYGQPGRADGLAFPNHLAWDIFAPLPFAGETFDFVYSSHALEDAHQPQEVLREWVRPLKVGGHLVLFLPDQPTYSRHCQEHHIPANRDHVFADFGLEFVTRRLPGNVQVLQSTWPFPGNAYSFALVARKTSVVAHLPYPDRMYES